VSPEACREGVEFEPHASDFGTSKCMVGVPTGKETGVGPTA